MNTDDFEKRLQGLPQREIPAGWRREILAEARVSARNGQTAPSTRQNHEERRAPRPVAGRWIEWLWPCPQAWAGLAAVWGVIIALQLHMPAGHAAQAGEFTAKTVPKTTALAARQREMTEWLEWLSPPTAVTPPSITRPRTERQRITAMG